MSFLELGQFADDWFSRIFDDYMMSPQKFSTDVLASICAGMVVEPAAYKPLLEKPQDVWASTNQPRRITVSWSADPNATRYEVMWTPLWYDRGDMAKEIREPVPEKNRTEMQREVVTEFDKDGYDIKRRMRAGDAYDIYVRAYNPMYSSPASKVVTGIAGEAFTTTTPSPIPNSYFDTGYSALLSAHNGDYEATALTTAANGVNKVWECYIAGISPTDETAKFEARIEIGADGKPVVKWSPDLNENGTKNERVYRVLGAKALNGEVQWDDVTDLQDYGAEQGYRFFKVDVELP